MKRSATVIWQGTGKEGSGQISTQSKVLNKAHYAYNTRFSDQSGTNPEELIAAAHASCYTMKLSFMLNEEGFIPDSVETISTVTLEGSTITESHLDVSASVPGIDLRQFEKIADKAKDNCPVSKALNMNITLDARLGEPVFNK